ncbi:hypothetical protein C2E23DRAFT_259179 [Lenzites betulinus]|nr:hypothetical protein C2E23DRAFT_259179 [Lenzites betulinus]
MYPSCYRLYHALVSHDIAPVPRAIQLRCFSQMDAHMLRCVSDHYVDRAHSTVHASATYMNGSLDPDAGRSPVNSHHRLRWRQIGRPSKARLYLMRFGPLYCTALNRAYLNGMGSPWSCGGGAVTRQLVPRCPQHRASRTTAGTAIDISNGPPSHRDYKRAGAIIQLLPSRVHIACLWGVDDMHTCRLYAHAHGISELSESFSAHARRAD